MKKRIFTLLMAVLIALSACMLSACPRQADDADSTAEKPHQEDDTYPSQSETTEDATVPATTLPPIVVELPERWVPLLSGKEMTASHYFVYDCDEGTFLTLSGDATARVYPASVTKLFSAYVALQYIDTDMEITAGSALELVAADSSVAGLQWGDTLTVEQLVAAMLLPSGNDAAYVLAVEVGRILEDDLELDAQTAVNRFVEQMNLHAEVLGMTGTHFANPDGMHDENHYTCIQDLVTIGTLATKHPLLSKYAATVTESIPMGEERSLDWTNTNVLLNPESDYYCSYTTGLKTGFTSAAGQCLLSSFQVEYRQLLIGVFGCPPESDRFAETLLLLCDTFDVEIPELPPEETTVETSAEAADAA